MQGERKAKAEPVTFLSNSYTGKDANKLCTFLISSLTVNFHKYLAEARP
jgi:hypothetical protein